MRSGPELYEWLAAIAAPERDAAIERALGLDIPVSSAPPGEHLVGHHMTGVAAIVRAIHEIPIRADDVVVDLGAGLGKIALLVRLLTGATVRGIEVQADLVALARSVGSRHGVRFDVGDARSAPLDDATVITLYCPFDGAVLEDVSRRLDALDGVAVCALGVDLRCQRLVARAATSFWSTIWDGGPPREPLVLSPAAARIASER